MAIEWKPQLSVGNETLDEQHKKVLNQINTIIAAIKERKGKFRVKGSISFLNEYINEHLSFEEEYMRKHGYPGLAEHKKIHENFIKSYIEFKNGLESEGPVLPLAFKVQKFIGDWWVNHIGKIDHAYYLYIKNQSK